jgi:hypothetical protein
MSLMATEERTAGTSGYFRIGDVVLDIPPEEIITSKITNNEEMTPIRAPYPFLEKTGHARWDVTIHWKALVDNTGGASDYSQWIKVRRILAMLKAAPFVEVENRHLRHLFIKDDTINALYSRMAFALKQLRVDVNPDLVDCLDCTLTMCLFNYRPFSKDFAYLGKDGRQVSAHESPFFAKYLDDWISNNLDAPYAGEDIDFTSAWDIQKDGTLWFKWREIIALPLTPVLGKDMGVVPSLGTWKRPPNSQQDTEADLANRRYWPWTLDKNNESQVTALRNAIIKYESVSAAYPHGGNPNAISPTGATGLMQWTSTSAIQTLSTLGGHYFQAAIQSGLLQRMGNGSLQWAGPDHMQSYHTWMTGTQAQTGLTSEQQLDMQNQMADTWMTMKLQESNYDVDQTLMHHLGVYEYYSSLNTVKIHGRDNYYASKPHAEEASVWWDNVVGDFRTAINDPTALQGSSPPQNVNTAAQASVQPVPATPTPNPPNQPATSTQNVTSESAPTAAEMKAINDKITEGWMPDHYTDLWAFLYWVHSMKLVDEEHGDSGPLLEMSPVDCGLWPTNLSVVFSNNLAQLPLQDEVYPTYQHMGPATTLVSVSFTSVGKSKYEEEEPYHVGLSWLTATFSTLDNQYHNYHSLWRMASTNHKIQGIVLQNKVLNMLGIRGILLDSFTTQTVKESPNVVQAEFSAYQFENVYEDQVAYRVAGIGTLEAALWWDMLAGTANGQPTPNHKLFNDFRAGLTPEQAAPYVTLFGLQDTLNNPTSAAAQSNLQSYLTENRGYLDDPGCRVIPMPADVENNPLWTQHMNVTDPGTVLQQFPNLQNEYPAIPAAMEAHVGLTYTDWFVLSRSIGVPTTQAKPYLSWLIGETPNLAGVPPTSSYTNYLAVAGQIDTLIANQATSQGIVQPITQLCQFYFNFKRKTDNSLLSAMLTIERMNNPLGQIFKNSINSGGPGRDPCNAEHGAYRDIGLMPVSNAGIDNNPAYYFYDYSNEMKASLGDKVTSAVTSALQAEDMINQVAGYPPTLDVKSISIADQNKSKTQRIQVATSESAPLLGSMSRAFPAFKLFFVEENLDKPFYMLDNFYSYANVLDMEIIKYRDQPDTAVLTITNKSHLLSHRLFDNTVAGRQERKDNIQLVNLPNAGPGMASPGYQGGAVINKTPNGFLEMKNLTDSLPGSTADNVQRASPNWFALQTGSKIQVRLGFTNNPDDLLPVFSGFVTDIQGDEVLTITAQGFMLELMSPAPDLMKRVGNVANYIAWNADAIGVMDTCLQSPYAKHFGHWQIGNTPNQFIKGFQWGPVIYSTFNALTTGRVRDVSVLLKQSYNRRNENLRINRFVSFDGSSTPQTARPWNYEGTAWGAFPPCYWIPDDTSVTPWQIMQDIARRYPEYILAVKDYGFPYDVAATLVYLDPNEWYFSRYQLPGDLEKIRGANISTDKFDRWWASQGRSQVEGLLGLGKSSTPQATTVLVGAVAAVMFGNVNGGWVQNLLSNTLARNALVAGSVATTPGMAALRYGLSVTPLKSPLWSTPAQLIVDWITQGHGPAFDQFVNASEIVCSSAIIPLITLPLPGMNLAHDFMSTVTGIQTDLYAYLHSTYGDLKTTLGDWMKPVRNWWFADRSVILENAITKNDDVFNAVQINGTTTAINDTIPEQYRHILVADKMCVNPKKNIGYQDPNLKFAYQASFLKEEIGKMYRGELVLLGSPEISPYDIIIISDEWMGMRGPVEVDSVIHSFSQETGYITIVKPRALVSVNERVTAPVYIVLSDLWRSIAKDVGLGARFSSIKAAASIQNDTITTGAVALAAGATLATVGISELATVGWLFGVNVTNLNPIIICPIERFGRPWVAGLQGFKISSLLGVVKDRYYRFCQSEFYPFIESWRDAERQYLTITN